MELGGGGIHGVATLPVVTLSKEGKDLLVHNSTNKNIQEEVHEGQWRKLLVNGDSHNNSKLIQLKIWKVAMSFM